MRMVGTTSELSNFDDPLLSPSLSQTLGAKEIAMRFTIHDVGHGFCAHLMHDNGNVMLWDCGHKTHPEHRPSQFLPESGVHIVHRMIITNYDEDHISDLPNLQNTVQIKVLRRNTSISPNQLRHLKEESGPITPAMSTLLSMMGGYKSDVTRPPSFPGVDLETFYCTYPTEFQDTNNLSLVSFLETPMGNFIVPGDIEKPAWQQLLRKQNFCNRLRNVTVFVASHHGRTSGYCREVFDYCSPEVVIFSDGPMQYATQEESSTYGAHASGVTLNGRTRRVLTTRNDGTLVWET